MSENCFLCLPTRFTARNFAFLTTLCFGCSLNALRALTKIMMFILQRRFLIPYTDNGYFHQRLSCKMCVSTSDLSLLPRYIGPVTVFDADCRTRLLESYLSVTG